MIDYEKKYKEALEWMKSLYNGLHGATKEEAEKHFPELAESKDEKIRKALVRFHKSTIDVDGIKGEEIVAWLEKQKSVSETVERCKNSWYNEGKIAGMTEGLTNDEKYQQGWHDALEKQGKQKITWSEEDESTLNELIIGFHAYKDLYPNFWKLRTDEIIEWLKKKKDEHTTDNG